MLFCRRHLWSTDCLFHETQRRFAENSFSRNISSNAFIGAHKFRDRVEVRLKTNRGKDSVVPVKLVRIFSPEFQQHFLFDPKTEMSEKFALGHGPGGSAANANKNAVTIKHVVTGIVVRCSKFRDLKANRRFAMCKIDAYLEYYLLGKYSRLGRILERKRQKYLGKISRKKQLKEERDRVKGEKILLFDFYTLEKFSNKAHFSVEDAFLKNCRDGAWQWLLKNGGKRALPWILPIPTDDRSQHPNISTQEFERLLTHSVGSNRLRLTVNACLEVFGLYLARRNSFHPGDEEYELLDMDINRKLSQYAMKCKREINPELWVALLQRLSDMCNLAGGSYRVVPLGLRSLQHPS
ncbi:peptide chain release factor C12orf65 [Perkinsela sp. CCAP 1560/4]|nr:peptide chain release factor C12orf65 [Perkinsela sp. CCAP 1560/4]|eukprot:KNH08235.1 peptide chain release factor C12orf65 [Perkinsela sp. CCAP 1560/4]